MQTAAMSVKDDFLDDDWFYGQLCNIPLHDGLAVSGKPSLDLRGWCGAQRGTRWRAMPETFWIESPRKSEWSRLLARLPQAFRDELEFLYTFILEALRHITPNLDTSLANHAYSEWLLYHDLESGLYREHIVHPVKVAVIARWLLDQSGAINRVKSHLAGKESAPHVKILLRQLTLSESIFRENSNGEKNGEKIIHAALWLAGLLHDLGYGHNFLCRLDRRMRSAYGFYPGGTIGGTAGGINPALIERSLLPRFLLDSQSWEHFKETGKLPELENKASKESWRLSLYRNLTNNHSVSGALNLLWLLQETVEYWPEIDPRLVLVFELAAEAIFLHDLAKKEKFVHLAISSDKSSSKKNTWPSEKKPFINFQDSPLAVILILADELQAWGRPRLRYDTGNDGDQVRVYFDKRRRDANGNLLEEKLWHRVQYEWKKPASSRGIRTLHLDSAAYAALETLKGPKDPKHPDYDPTRFSYEGFLNIESL